MASYPESETPTPVPGYKYSKTRITSTGGYDSFNVPFFNVTEYGDSTRTGERFLYDGHTSSNLNIGMPLKELPPSTNWGHWHANMVGALGQCLRQRLCADLRRRAGPRRTGRRDQCQ